MFKKCNFDQIYDILQYSFPKNEFRPYDEQKNLLINKKYQIITNDDIHEKVNGFLSFWTLQNIKFIEHIAVKSDIRGQGIGSDLIKKYILENPGRTVLEVEVPSDKVKKRRVRFYEKSGFHLNLYFYSQPSFIAGQLDIPMYIMSYPDKLALKDFIKIRDDIYKNIYFI